jgi:hypothetical protein
VVLKKGEYKLAVTLHKRLIGYNRQLGISIRNEGNTVYEGRCEMLTSISMQGTPEFIVAFVPKYTKQHIKNEIEPRGKERLLVGHRVTPPLDLAPGEECEYMGCEFSTPVKSKDVGFKCVGKLYAKHL